MKISEIYIKGLYGNYSYHIKELASRNLLVLTGYNGMGKTTILNIIKSIAESNLWFFYELLFEKIHIIFEDGLSLKMAHLSSIGTEANTEESNKNEADKNTRPEGALTYEWWQGDKLLCHICVDQHEFYEAYSRVSKVGYIAGEDNDDWKTLMRPQMGDVVAYICKKQNAMAFDMVQSSVKAFMIPAQRVKQIRMVSYEEERFPFPQESMEEVDTINLIAENFRKMLDKKRMDFFANIQKSKMDLMNRLLDSDTKDLGAEEYAKVASHVQANIDDLKQFGIAYESIRNYVAHNGQLLSAYLLNLKENLEEYSGFLKDLKLFASIIEKKHFLHKRLNFSPAYGFKVFDDKGISISPSKLSSGEQNVIILLYRIIFEVQDGEILLIDEPEISMHVVWLKEFIEELLTIAASKKKIQILIATHSPQIVRGAFEHCFDLEINNYGK